MTSAYVSEIYSSVQGEGPYAGQKQIFFRLAGCPFRCHYCDTLESLTIEGHTRMTPDEALAALCRLRDQDHVRVVSVTGGEPLIQSAFLERLLPRLKQNKFNVYLESAGIHHRELAKIISFVDTISMDLKIPSSIGRPYWDEHAEFLFVGKGKIFVKIVVEKKNTLEEIKEGIDFLTRQNYQDKVVIQPATNQPPLTLAPSPEFVDELHRFAAKVLPEVLIKPQQHVVWGVR